MDNDWIDLGKGTLVRRGDIESVEPPHYSGSSPDRTVAIVTMRSGKTHLVAWNSGISLEGIRAQLRGKP